MAEIELHIKSWDALLSGDRSALEAIYHQHYIGLLNYGIKLTQEVELSKDCIFQLFITLWDSRSKLPSVTNVRSYLITSLHRELLHVIRRNHRKLSNGPAYNELYPVSEFSYEDYLVQKQQSQERRDRVKLAFAQLSQREKQLLELKFFEGHSYKHIAESCNITKRTAYNIIHTAIKNIRDVLHEERQAQHKTHPASLGLGAIFLAISFFSKLFSPS